MNMRIISTALLFCILQVCSGQNILTRQFSKPEGLPDPYVYTLTEDSAGFLWVSTGKGLVTFDGQFFGKPPRPLPAEEIAYASALQANGDLWFGTFSGKLFRYRQGEFSLFPQTCQATVTRIIPEDHDDHLVIGTRGAGIFLKRGDQLIPVQGSELYQIEDIALLHPGLLLVATDEGLFSLDPNSHEFRPIPAGDSPFIHICLLTQTPNTAIAGNSNGQFYQVSDSPDGLKVQPLNIPSIPLIRDFICNEEKQAMYIITREERMFVLDLKRQLLQAVSENDFSAGANCLYRDRSGNTWLGSPGKGLYRISSPPYDVLDLGEPVFAITRDETGRTYYGTSSGIRVHDAGGRFLRHIGRTGNKTAGKINALYIHSGQLWIGYEGQGLSVIRLSDDRDLRPEFSAIPNISVNSISGRGGQISVTTNLDGVFNYKGLELAHHFSVRNSLLHNNVLHALISRNGRTYYATHNTSFNHSCEGELFEIDLKSLGLVAEFNGFSEDSKGVIAIATNGDGVYLMKDSTITPLNLGEGLDSRFCEAVIFDRNDDLWILQRYRLFRYHTRDSVLNEIHLSASGQYILNPEAIYSDSTGKLYLGTNKGELCFDPGRALPETVRPYLVRVRVQDSLMDPALPARLKYGSYHLVFDFSALGLKNSENVRFRYKLEGRDEHWSELSALRRAEFSRLGEGHYALKVIAVNAEGFPSAETLLYEFDIDSPFWKKPLFWLLATLALAGLFLLIIRARTQALLRIKQFLEREVTEKTKELREEKNLVIEKNRHIEEQNQEILDSITYAKRIQQALLPDKEALSAEHKNLFVFYQPRDIVSGDFYWLADLGKLQIIVAADCTGHGVPGAFMSMVGSTLLNKIILEKKITRPGKILEELDREVIYALKQHSEDATRDGMDICLCVLDREEKTLCYAGAMRPLFFVNQRQLTEYSPTKFSIGGFSYGAQKEFRETLIDVSGQEMFYLFSDGYADQFGGDKGKKLMLKNFKKILISISDMELDKQEENLKRVYNNWKGTLDQIDDVLVIGVRV